MEVWVKQNFHIMSNPVLQPELTFIWILNLIASISGSGNVLKVQQLLHICSEHYEAKEKEKEDDKEKKDKKDKDKKESDMGSHQVKIFSHQLFASVSLPDGLWLDLYTFNSPLRV